MHDLFTYGTLMCTDVMAAVTGRTYEGFPAQLWHYRRLRVLHADYPGIIEADGHSVGGWVYRGISDAGLSRLDRFEGNIYRRASVVVDAVDGSVVQVFAYVVKKDCRNRLETVDWDYDAFRRGGLHKFLKNLGRGYQA